MHIPAQLNQKNKGVSSLEKGYIGVSGRKEDLSSEELVEKPLPKNQNAYDIKAVNSLLTRSYYGT